MMTFAALQTGVPTITAPQIMLSIAIAGGVVFLVKFGAFVGVMVKAVTKDFPAMFEKMTRELERLSLAVESIDRRLEDHIRTHG